MLVSAFMIPASQVVTCSEWDPILNVIDAVLDRHISAVVVVDKKKQPTGILTKTDLVRAYQHGVSLHQKVGLVMVAKLLTLAPTTTRDDAAAFLEEHRIHHAVVMDQGQMVGLVSSWDIAAEVAKDGKAWPYFRTATGRVAGAAH